MQIDKTLKRPPNYIYLVFSPPVSYENVDNVFIEIDRIREVFKESLISFNKAEVAE
jgi:hypothetical protein